MSIRKPSAAGVYLTATFAERVHVKALGARFDGATKQWFVPHGLDLAPFERWLPVGASTATTLVTRSAGALVAGEEASSSTALAERRGISLSELMSGVAGLVANAYRQGVWTVVEVGEVRSTSGHVYIEVTEHNAAGVQLAKAKATVWKATADRLLPRFEAQTGIVLGPGIKLLVRAKPVAHRVHGLTLNIDDIDPAFTLGDLEARRREIRARLTREGVFGDNKALEAPWDYRGVLVIAPEQAAGLGDFRREADRLEHHGVCRFIYAHAIFQGEGAEASILAALEQGLAEWMATWEERQLEPLPDAICIIRGGGSASDLAWLDRYELASWICRSPVPVLTGIGHERDSTILDEVAHCAYDTPSKVILGIENIIRSRADEVRKNMALIEQVATRATATMRRQVGHAFEGTLQDARLQVHRARTSVAEAMALVRERAPKLVAEAARLASDSHQAVRAQASVQLATARQQTPALLESIAQCAHQALRTAAANAQQAHAAVNTAARVQADQAGRDVAGRMDEVGQHAQRVLRDARAGVEAHFREIVSQGPKRTLERGFAIVRAVPRSGAPQASPITSADSARRAGTIDLEFHDGRVVAHVDEAARDHLAAGEAGEAQ